MSDPANTMRIATTVCTEVESDQTRERLIDGVRGALGEHPPDLCVLLASAHFEDELESLADAIYETLHVRVQIGMTGETVICDGRELESHPAIALWAAYLPGAQTASFHLSQDDLERMESPEDLREHLRLPDDVEPSFVLLGDPFSINVLELVERFNDAFPGCPAVGGLASAGEEPGQNRLVFDGHTLHHGLVGAALWGNVRIDTVVSQGCRPIGRHLVITKAERNVIHQLGGKPTMAAVNDLLKHCPPRDLELARGGLLIGRVINEYQREFGSGDFLIRNPIGFDQQTGAMAVNDLVRTGQTVQFHVRDETSADEDLATLLTCGAPAPAAGALVFSCNSRGTRLFTERNHDARAVIQARGDLPLAGLFCAGEIGPVGKRNYLHGHTASIGFVRPVRAGRK